MNRILTKSFALIALVGAFTLSAATKSEAALTMTLTTYNAANVQQQTTGVITDNSGLDSTAALGAVTFNGAIGAWIVNVDTGLGAPILPDQPHLDLNYLTAAPGAAVGDYLVIDFTDTAETAGAASIGMKIGGTNNGTTTSASVLVNGVQTGALGPFAGSPFSGTGSAAIGVATPYSLTQRIVITRVAGGTGNASGDFEIVPEPATMSLFGLGLAGVAALRRRRQAK
jgi:hypothetical protein